MLSIKSPNDIALELAQRLRERRLDNAWSREELASRAGVTVASLKRFELTGDISLKRLLSLCFTLHAVDGFDQLLLESEPRSIAEIEKRLNKRQRGRRKSK